MVIFLFLIFISANIHYRFTSLYIQTFLIALVSTVTFDLAFLKLRGIKLFFPHAAIITGTIIGLIASLNLSWYQLPDIFIPVLLLGNLAFFCFRGIILAKERG